MYQNLRMLKDRYLVELQTPQISETLVLPEVMDQFGFGVIRATHQPSPLYFPGEQVLFDQHSEVLFLGSKTAGPGTMVVLREDSILATLDPAGDLWPAPGYDFYEPMPLPYLRTAEPSPEEGWIYELKNAAMFFVAKAGAGYIIWHKGKKWRLLSEGDLMASLESET